MEGQSKLPQGFRVGTDGLSFVPQEVPKKVTMNVTAIVLDEVCAVLCVYALRRCPVGGRVMICGRSCTGMDGVYVPY